MKMTIALLIVCLVACGCLSWAKTGDPPGPHMTPGQAGYDKAMLLISVAALLLVAVSIGGGVAFVQPRLACIGVVTGVVVGGLSLLLLHYQRQLAFILLIALCVAAAAAVVLAIRHGRVIMAAVSENIQLIEIAKVRLPKEERDAVFGDGNGNGGAAVAIQSKTTQKLVAAERKKMGLAAP